MIFCLTENVAYRPPRPVSGVALLFICRWWSYLTGSIRLYCLILGSFCFFYEDDVCTSQEAHATIACYKDSFTLLYVDDVCTSQEAHAFTTCYKDSFTLLYVDDVCTSQEAHASIACYRDSFTVLYVDDVCTSQEAHATIACYKDSFTLLYVDDVCTSQEAHASTAWYKDSFTLLYVDDVWTSQEAHVRASTTCCRDGFTLLFISHLRPWNSVQNMRPRQPVPGLTDSWHQPIVGARVSSCWYSVTIYVRYTAVDPSPCLEGYRPALIQLVAMPIAPWLVLFSVVLTQRLYAAVSARTCLPFRNTAKTSI
jgi:hypothetical protein